MKQIATVTGRVQASALGHCQPHEHLYVAPTPASAANPALCIDDEERSAAELRDYAALGGETVVDCQPLGAGRDLAALRRISRASGVQVIAEVFHIDITGERLALCDRLARQ